MSLPPEEDDWRKTMVLPPRESWLPDQSGEPVPPPPMAAWREFMRAVRHALLTPKPSARETAILEVLVALDVEIQRHRSRLVFLRHALQSARGRR
ncbi:MAG: hypothetical protein WBY94_28315 [Polyangiaceae bacterium]